MSDVLLRSAIIKLAHAHPELRGDLLPLIKSAGCEKLPEGGMRDNCEKKKEEGASNDKEEDAKKEAALKVAVKEETSDFVEWVMNTQMPKSEAEVIRILKGPLKLEIRPPQKKREGPRFIKGDRVEIKGAKHTDVETSGPYEEFNGKIGTVVDTEDLDVMVKLDSGPSVPVRFALGMKPRGVGIYRYTPMFEVVGSPKVEMVYLSGGLAKEEQVLTVQLYQSRGKPGEKRPAVYYTGHINSAQDTAAGTVVFKGNPQQRLRVDPAAEGGFEWRSFSPAKGKVLWLGLFGDRPDDWKDELEEIRGEVAAK